MKWLIASWMVLLGASAYVSEGARPRDDESEPAKIRTAVEKALPVLQSSASKWFERRSCTSCHHHALGAMTLQLARERGFTVDETRAAEQLARLGASSAGAREEILQEDAGINAQAGQGYRLLGRGACGVSADAMSDARWHFLVGAQQPDGSWRSGSHRPPLEDSAFTLTAIDARVIQLYAPPGRVAEVAQRVKRAHTWLASARAQTTEERTMQLFGLAWTAGTPAEIERARNELAGAQRADGGWSQIATRDSDAYATGQALVALNQAGGLATTDPIYRRGIEFLLRTRLEDGTWLVTTRRKSEGLEYFETGFPHGENQFISCAATNWAVMALCATIEPKPSPTWLSTAALSRATDAPAPDDGVTPLMLAALYEDVPAIQRRLDAGDDVNATSVHGLTALMCAVDDVDKTRLLLEHGAKVDARSEQGCTALQIAAARDGGTRTLELLIARGGDVKASAKNGTNALLRAALSGDKVKVDLLLAAGAKIDDGGNPQFTPLLAAVYLGDAAMVRHLIERGATVKSPGSGGAALNTAVIDGSTEVVHALLGAGAPLDLRDDEGLTPLMWAATLDWGDSAVLAALIARGADVHAKTEHGETALSRAEANGNRAHAEALRKAGALE